MHHPTFFTMSDQISMEEGMSTMMDSVTQEMMTQDLSDSLVAVTQALNMDEDDAVTVTAEQKAADKSVCVMITHLISGMRNPVSIQSNIQTRNVGTQAGFSCFYCDLTFKTSAGLFKHDRAKHAVLPFRCVHCNKGYITMQGLTNHLKVKHSIVVKQIKTKQN